MYLRLNQITRNPRLQPRVAIDEDTAGEYALCLKADPPVQLPPVVVFRSGQSVYLADGYHRFRAHELAGLGQILVDVRQGAFRDALLFSLGANTKHGLRRTNEDKRKAVQTMLDDPEWSRWSNRRIAGACGVTEGLVRRLLQDENELVEGAYNTHPGSLLDAADLDLLDLPADVQAIWSGLTPAEQREILAICKADSVEEAKPESAPSDDSSKPSRNRATAPSPSDTGRLLRECERYLFVAQKLLERWQPSPRVANPKREAMDQLVRLRDAISGLRLA